MISVNDELNDLKSRLAELGAKVHKFEKIGNGNMSAFRMYFSYPHSDAVHETFFWRYDMDTFEQKLIKKIKEETHR